MKRQKKSKKNLSKHSRNISGVIKITGKPVGFVATGDENQEDIIIFEENLNCALNNDEVEVEVVGRDRNRVKGKVVRIIKRHKTQFVGTLEKSPFGLVLNPDDWKFYKKIEIKNPLKDAKPGLKALVSMENWNNPNISPKGRILEIIGEKGKHETEMQSILLDRGIVYDFPPEVEREAELVAAEFRKSMAEDRRDFKNEVSKTPLKLPQSQRGVLDTRRDFRNILTFTIDPADAKDFDDALSYEDLGSGKLKIGVHIADVSHFVRPGGALDKEAQKRGLSTYLVDRTIPMLPEVLSNDLCSLNPGVDRLAFSAVFEIEKNNGKILNRWFGKTIINSNKRFSYEEAQELLTSPLTPLLASGEGKHISSRNSSISPPPSPASRGRGGDEVLKNALDDLNRLANIYRKENKDKGAIEFETDEVKFELDDEGKPIRVYKKPRLETMKMIEEWMLLANREVAKFLSDKIGKRGGASIYRIHGSPNIEKIQELAIFLRSVGYDLPVHNGEVKAQDINQMLKEIEGHSAESLIKTAAIRSMAKAVYSTKNIGHFGLAFEYYTHFTSPIRRYPDLLIHRILYKYLKNDPLPKNEFARFERIAEEASEKEINVAEAERESIKYKQVEFMQNQVGEEFDGVISGVTEWGMYVELPDTKAEGLVRLKDMTDDYYELDQRNYAIVGSRNKKKYSLGDTVGVRLTAADLDRKTLDFKLIE